ncbi:Imm6 family immunity protein [Listeria portnoyi]|uniref:Imm6 family immunity protein n=1 Tax=Listeria portnoyi TaxID=2713504 RepID=UPI001FE57DF0|nr:Imm6 family immunity protein [Listeria portnoyi]
MVETMSVDQQVSFYLGLSEDIIPLLKQSKYFEDARKALDLCWEWLEKKEITGDQIYYILDDGTEFAGLFMQMQMDETPENEDKWECIVSAVSFVDKQAYLQNNEPYLPAPIENIDDTLLQYFLDCYINVMSDGKERIKSLYEFVISKDSPSKSDILSFIAKN